MICPDLADTIICTWLTISRKYFRGFLHAHPRIDTLLMIDMKQCVESSPTGHEPDYIARSVEKKNSVEFKNSK